MSFGEKIKKLRTDKQLTLDELSESTGLSKGYLSKLENGHRGTPKAETITKLARGLDIEYEDLMFHAGYISKQEFNRINELIKNTDHINDLKDTINAPFLGKKLKYEGEYLSLEDSIYISNVLRAILKKGIPSNEADKQKELDRIME